MKKLAIGSLIFFLFFHFCKLGWASEQKILLLDKTHELEISLFTSYLDYTEDLKNSREETEKGLLFPGIQGSHLYKNYNPFGLYGKLVLRYLSGNTDYTNDSGRKLDTTNEFFSVEGTFGLAIGFPARAQAEEDGNFFSEETSILYVYTGVGYKFWDRYAGKTLPERPEFFYFPLGGRLYHQFSSILVYLDVSAQLIIPGEIQIDFSRTDPTLPRVNTELNDPGWGFRVELGGAIPFLSSLFLTGSVWYQLVYLSRSRPFFLAGTLTQYPQNTSHEFGVSLGLKISF